MKRLNLNKKENRKNRHLKIARKFKRIDNGLHRLLVTKTNGHIYAQLIDDSKNVTIVSSSSLQLGLKNGNKENSSKVGEDIAKKALKKNIKEINFDRGGSKYHGRVQILADSARKNGLVF
ncbi:MAG: 50S ribosomal protein L18 [Mycoplasmoidaceae bacterium]